MSVSLQVHCSIRDNTRFDCDYKDAMTAAMKDSGPVLADVPSFTDTQPQMLIGEVVG